MREITKIIIHCSDSEFGDRQLIRKWHVDERGWDDIGYHAIICNGYAANTREFNPAFNGLIQIGRPMAKAGAHCRGHNQDSLGICLIGTERFTQAQWRSLGELVRVWQQLFTVPNANVGGHRDFQRRAAGSVKTCPNFDVATWRMVTEPWA